MNSVPRWLRLATVILLFTLSLSVGLIGLGVFDPKPIGRLVWEQELATQEIAVESRRIIWLDREGPNAEYSIRLSAAYQSGELDSGYGLVVGDPNQHLAVSVSPLGYVAVTLTARPDVEDGLVSSVDIIPWQTWPHVSTDQGMNEIWLDLRGKKMTIWINREILWQGAVELPTGHLGIVGESFGESVIINYQHIQLFFE